MNVHALRRPSWVVCAAIIATAASILFALTPASPAGAKVGSPAIVTAVSGTPVTVSSQEGWQSTGVQVVVNSHYNVVQNGGRWSVDYVNFPYVDGAGYPPDIDARIYQGCKLQSSWPYGLLVGRVGEDGPTFPIGRAQGFDADRSGTLYLRIHDTCLGDNRGSLNVVVQVATNAPAGAAATRNDGIARIEVVNCLPLERATVDGTNQYGKQAHWDSSWAREFQRGTTSFQTWNWWWTGQVQIRMWTVANPTDEFDTGAYIPPKPITIQDPIIVQCYR